MPRKSSTTTKPKTESTVASSATGKSTSKRSSTRANKSNVNEAPSKKAALLDKEQIVNKLKQLKNESVGSSAGTSVDDSISHAEFKKEESAKSLSKISFEETDFKSPQPVEPPPCVVPLYRPMPNRVPNKLFLDLIRQDPVEEYSPIHHLKSNYQKYEYDSDEEEDESFLKTQVNQNNDEENKPTPIDLNRLLNQYDLEIQKCKINSADDSFLMMDRTLEENNVHEPSSNNPNHSNDEQFSPNREDRSPNVHSVLEDSGSGKENIVLSPTTAKKRTNNSQIDLESLWDDDDDLLNCSAILSVSTGKQPIQEIFPNNKCESDSKRSPMPNNPGNNSLVHFEQPLLQQKGNLFKQSTPMQQNNRSTLKRNSDIGKKLSFNEIEDDILLDDEDLMIEIPVRKQPFVSPLKKYSPVKSQPPSRFQIKLKMKRPKSWQRTHSYQNFGLLTFDQALQLMNS